METVKLNPADLQNWRLVTTPPLSGEENMRYDRALLQNVEEGKTPPTLRFFRFKDPTVSFGRLQKLSDVLALVPAGWKVVQRPTGGGIVFHQNDLCLSLVWARGQALLPVRPQDQYRWIHGVILSAMDDKVRMAGCCDVNTAAEPFGTRRCFANPAGFDLLKAGQKIVGGALACRHRATLYQGSIQTTAPDMFENRVAAAFRNQWPAKISI